MPIITLGRNGLVFLPAGAAVPEWVPAERVQLVDSTGAGDSFCGAFGFFLSHFDLSDSALPREQIRGGPVDGQVALREVLRRSVYVATQSVTRAGSQTSPSRDELPEALFAATISTATWFFNIYRILLAIGDWYMNVQIHPSHLTSIPLSPSSLNILLIVALFVLSDDIYSSFARFTFRNLHLALLIYCITNIKFVY